MHQFQYTSLENWKFCAYAFYDYSILISLISFFYSKKSIESTLFANYWAAISRICKNAVFWSADKIFLFHFVRINKLNAFAGDLPTEKLKISS